MITLPGPSQEEPPGLPGFIGESTNYHSHQSSSQQQTSFLSNANYPQFHSNESAASSPAHQFHSYHPRGTVLRLPTPPPSYNATVGTRLNIFSPSRGDSNGAYYGWFEFF